MQGYTELLELLRQHREHKGYNLPVDVYGTGEDLEAIKARAEDYQLEVSFKGARDHLDDSIHPYRSSCAFGIIPCNHAITIVVWPHTHGSCIAAYLTLRMTPACLEEVKHHILNAFMLRFAYVPMPFWQVT